MAERFIRVNIPEGFSPNEVREVYATAIAAAQHRKYLARLRAEGRQPSLAKASAILGRALLPRKLK